MTAFTMEHTEANYHAWLREQQERDEYEEAARQVEAVLEALAYNATAQRIHFDAMLAGYEQAA